jgi:hypothetical protein
MTDATDVETIMNEVIEVSDEHRQTVFTCSETLSKMGYEIVDDESLAADFIIHRGGESYTLIVVSDEKDDDYLGIPVGNLKYGINIFRTTADYIAFHHGDHIYQFKTKDLCEFLRPKVVKLKDEGQIAYSTRETAIEMKRLHAKCNYNYDCDSYDIMLYLSIKFLCERLEHIKQKAG